MPEHLYWIPTPDVAAKELAARGATQEDVRLLLDNAADPEHWQWLRDAVELLPSSVAVS